MRALYHPQLDTFVAVVECGSFAKAAQSLYISTTAVIKQINALEERFGLQLLERTARGTTLPSAAGTGTSCRFGPAEPRRPFAVPT